MKSHFHIFFIVFSLLNCKEKNDTYSTIPSYIPQNKDQVVVADYSNAFSSTERDSLTSKIINYKHKTTNEIAVLTIDTVPEDLDIQFFGTKVAQNWGIGKKEKNNGLLIVLAKIDQKVAIVTGIGTEETISDYECKVIIDRIMTPQFKDRNYYEGVSRAIDSLALLWD